VGKLQRALAKREARRKGGMGGVIIGKAGDR
jgi:hypothetical protein